MVVTKSGLLFVLVSSLDKTSGDASCSQLKLRAARSRTISVLGSIDSGIIDDEIPVKLGGTLIDVKRGQMRREMRSNAQGGPNLFRDNHRNNNLNQDWGALRGKVIEVGFNVNVKNTGSVDQQNISLWTKLGSMLRRTNGSGIQGPQVKKDYWYSGTVDEVQFRENKCDVVSSYQTEEYQKTGKMIVRWDDGGKTGITILYDQNDCRVQVYHNILVSTRVIHKRVTNFRLREYENPKHGDLVEVKTKECWEKAEVTYPYGHLGVFRPYINLNANRSTRLRLCQCSSEDSERTF